MGSFTTAASKTIMDALFPTSTTSLVPFSATSTNVNLYRIYNSHNAAGSQIGLFCATTASVKHRIDLIIGSNTTVGAPSTVLNDTNFASDTLNTTTNTPTAGATIQFPNTTAGTAWNYYPGYTGSLQGDTGISSNTWTGWTLTTSSNKGQAVNNAQVAFPPMGTTGSPLATAWGFCINAATQTSTATSSVTQVIATPTAGNPVILAYGDLSTARTINGGDTPVFTNGAITITLE